MKDYHDLFLLIRREKVLKNKKLKETLLRTFENRETTLKQIQFSEENLKVMQSLWSAHIHGLGNISEELNLPKDLTAVIHEINQYIASILPISV